MIHIYSCICSTMGVGRQSRRVCFGAKPDKGFLDKKISPYPEVVRGRERELTTRPRREELVAGRAERQLVAGEQKLVAGPERGVAAGQERGEQLFVLHFYRYFHFVNNNNKKMQLIHKLSKIFVRL